MAAACAPAHAKQPRVQEAFSQTASLAADMNQAVAVAELVGSANGGKHVGVIYDKAKACAGLFQGHEFYCAALAETPSQKPLPPLSSAA